MIFEEVHKKILNALKDEDLRNGSYIGTKFEIINRKEAIKRHPYVEEWAKETRKIKEKNVNEIDELILKFKENFEKNGGNFHYAQNGEEMKDKIVEIIGNGKTLVKSKSLVGEEIELRQFLEEKGIKVYETDLGEFLVQLTNGKPAHMVTPAVNMTQKRAKSVLEKNLNVELDDVTSMVLAVRKFMRKKFLSADVGMVGANALSAETGSVVFVTNEGNGAITSTVPRKLIVITSIEKIYPTLKDAIKASIVQTVYDGYKKTSYIHIINGPSMDNIGPNELHVVLLDNNRKNARETFLKETLYCIKCGSCQLSCPIFQVIDGAWGDIYTAAIGIPWTAITGSKERAKALSLFCLNCGKCKEVCPMNINIPELIRKIKSI